MNGVLLQNRVVLFEFNPFCGILPVFVGHITGSAGKTAVFVLCAFQDYLEPVSFAFLGHDLRLSEGDVAFFVKFTKVLINTFLIDGFDG